MADPNPLISILCAVGGFFMALPFLESSGPELFFVAWFVSWLALLSIFY
jgi:uncharacterized membrane protein